MRASKANLLKTIADIKTNKLALPQGLRGIVAKNYGKEFIDLEVVEKHIQSLKDNELECADILFPKKTESKDWLLWWEKTLVLLFIFRHAAPGKLDAINLDSHLVVDGLKVYAGDLTIKGDLSFDINEFPCGLVVLGNLTFEGCAFVKGDYDKSLDIVCLGDLKAKFISMGSGKVVVGGLIRSEIVHLHYNHAELIALGGVECRFYIETDTSALIAGKFGADAVYANESYFYDPAKENAKASYTSHTNLFGLYSLRPDYNKLFQFKEKLIPAVWQEVVGKFPYSKQDSEFKDDFTSADGEAVEFKNIDVNRFWLSEVVDFLSDKITRGEPVFVD